MTMYNDGGLRLLSLDGGGIRGLSQLIILREIMSRVKIQEGLESPPPPCAYFDMICGTSTGGIIAIMLGRLRMSVDDALDNYCGLAEEVFSDRNHLGDGKFNTSTLEKAIKRIVKNRTQNEDERMFDVSDEACKTFVCAMTAENMQSPRLFRTYHASENPSINCTIWEAARATSAVLNFFKDIEIIEDGVKERFVDGGLGCNNPIRKILQEAELSFPGRRVACVVSVGTGQIDVMRISRSRMAQRWMLPQDLVKTLERLTTDCEKTAEEINFHFKKQSNVYFRLNVEHGMQDITLTEWERMGAVKTHTLQYLARVEVNEKVNSVVKAIRERQGAIGVEQLNGIEPSRNISHKELLPKIRAWLTAPDPAINFNKACEARHGDTGQWFIQGSMFEKWKSEARSLLWIHGIPGSGKTILSSTIINSIKCLRESDPSLALAYFFFDFRNPSTQRCRSLMYSLITQLCRPSSTVPPILADLYDQNEDGTMEPDMIGLKAAFKEILGLSRHSYIILDALDECNRSDRTVILRFLEEVISWKLENLHLLVTSRTEGDIEECLQPILSSRMDLADFVQEDIQIYLSDVLKNDKSLQRWKEKEKSLIESTLLRQADGMFLLVRCQVEEVGNCPTVKHLKKRLADLPKSLEETYKRILDAKIHEDHREYVFKILGWLAFSFQPVKLLEIAAALEFDFERCCVDPDNKLQDPLDVVKMCPGMVNFNKDDGVVGLSHSSVKEFLISHTEGFEPASVHTFMARTCLAYLLQFTDLDGIGGGVLSEFPLALYAAKYWTQHVRFEDVANDDLVVRLMKTLLRQYGVQFVNWVRLYDADNPWRHSVLTCISYAFPRPLYYTALIGLHRASSWLIDEGADVNAYGGVWGNALVAASSHGHEKVVRLLLENGANIKAGNALWLASYHGHEDVVRLLLKNGADVTANDALRCASLRGHERIVGLLLENGLDVNAGNPLWSASNIGHEGIVRKLLENGADANTGNPLRIASFHGHEGIMRLLLENGASADDISLRHAARDGHEGIVRLLIQNGVDVNAQGETNDSALSAASSHGHEGIVRLLLENGASADDISLRYAARDGFEGIVRLLIQHGVDLNAQGRTNENVLSAASSHGHEDVVRLLLKNGASADDISLRYASRGGYEGIVRLLIQHGVDLNAQGRTNDNALSAASWDGRENIVRLLLEKGADVNAQQGNALLSAAWGGHERIVQLLIQNGADATAQAGYALLSASSYGHEGVVRVLLEHGVDVNAEGGMCGNALQFASREGHADIVRLLLENGADVNAHGVYGSSLQYASSHGDERIVRLLLEYGADVSAHGGHVDALQYASWGGHQKIAQLLLERGADVNTHGGNALHAAAWHGHEGLVRLLLENGADVNAQGGIALLSAVCHGHERTVQLLLENGADVNVQGVYGSGLQYASSRGHEGIVRLLLEKGADVNARGVVCDNALHAASRCGHDKIMRLLMENGADVNGH